ncbi:hypothetical protein LSTR_LSTR014643 [Laodelphax striatellus]|uniref:Uncharacterized protein n=1 Tax=Laodelphax striatellus TaxID=195883 RepID=A0A482X1N7_LAOST|nr:hypothetical protein LSTR_LSTR014643 [Laodelphax striatellus]
MGHVISYSGWPVEGRRRLIGRSLVRTSLCVCDSSSAADRIKQRRCPIRKWLYGDDLLPQLAATILTRWRPDRSTTKSTAIIDFHSAPQNNLVIESRLPLHRSTN